MVSRQQFKKDGWWQMEESHTTYKNGRKMPYKFPRNYGPPSSWNLYY
jgi:hypothetical protein